MKTSKKILMLFVGLLTLFTISFIPAYALHVLFQLNLPACITVILTLQLLGKYGIDKYKELQEIEVLKEYASKPFRPFNIDLNCSVCGRANQVEIDLNDSEFDCDNCKRKNSIHIAFSTAAVTKLV